MPTAQRAVAGSYGELRTPRMGHGRNAAAARAEARRDGWWVSEAAVGIAIADRYRGAMDRITSGPKQESVWDYPRPPRIEPEHRSIRIVLGGKTIAATDRALRVLETSHPPGIYIPPDSFTLRSLHPNSNVTVCEWKGTASYWDLTSGEATAVAAGWSYEDPRPGFEAITGFISVYPSRVDACFLDNEIVRPQNGHFYGGWITDEIVGPFKGAPGTIGW